MIEFMSENARIEELWSLLRQAVELLESENVDLAEKCPHLDYWNKDQERALKAKRKQIEKKRQEAEKTHNTIMALREKMTIEEWDAMLKMAFEHREGPPLYEYFSLDDRTEKFGKTWP